MIMRLLLLVIAYPFFCSGQFHNDVSGYLMNKSHLSGRRLLYPLQVNEFYTSYKPGFCWLGIENRRKLDSLTVILNRAAEWGLKSSDYQYIADIRSWEDSAEADITITDAAIHFLHDISVGNAVEELAYNGLKYQPSCNSLAKFLAEAVDQGRFSMAIQKLEPDDGGYKAVKSKLNELLVIASVPGFTDITITSPSLSLNNDALVKTLCQLGILRNDSILTSDSLLKSAVKQSQFMFNLLHDGTLRNTTIDALNVSIRYRLAELRNTLNALRWLNNIKHANNLVLVNIPSASLIVYQNGTPVLESRIMPGKPATPTPTLCSSITEVVLYPYWNVPNKIATRELLPMIKRNRLYLADNNFQVLNKQGRIMDVNTISWDKLTAENFPFLIRQSTGCDNSLGLIKLNFFSPFDVYLHDTPWKILFNFNNRYFSHGCMRLEKARELAHYVLDKNSIAIDTLDEENCLKNKQPVFIKTSTPVPVFVVYHTAWVDSSNRLVFYVDPYKKNKLLQNKTEGFQ